jgi:hypothetical protein
VQQAFGGPSVLPHTVFWGVDGKSLAGVQQIQAQSDGISSHHTLSVAAEPFHVLHMDPMLSDVSMCNKLLVAHQSHPMMCSGLWLGKFRRCAANPSPK